ncbi:MAG TPA: hypothetical protein VHP63_00160, partial [candidate division Zixibacteria bacterium]|nr:hypothetical protein [candidate division Zixibacteria bacterium]
LQLIIICLATTFAIPSQSKSQNKRAVLFARDNTFLPQIYKLLSELENYQTDEKIFSEIINLNQWSINRSEIADFDNLLRFYESEGRIKRKGQEAKEIDRELIRLFEDVNTYIRIDVLLKLHLLEFQLLITDSLPQVASSEYAILVTPLSRMEGFVIDISRQDFLKQLNNEVKKLFPKSNRPPIPIVKLNAELNSDSCYYFGIGREICIDASESYDMDNSQSDILYHWRQINPRGEALSIGSDEIIILQDNAPVQKIRIQNRGEYLFGVRVDDGISMSSEVVYKLSIQEVPINTAILEHKIVDKNIFKKGGTYKIPISVNSSKGHLTNVSVVQVTAKPIAGPVSSFFRRNESRPVYFGTTHESISDIVWIKSSSDTTYFEIVLGKDKLIRDYEYKFSVVSNDGYVKSDSTVVRLANENKNVTTNLSFFQSKYIEFGKIDSVDERRRTAFDIRYSMRLYGGKDFYFEFGPHIRLWNNGLENPHLFELPYFFIGCGYGNTKLTINFADSNIGIGTGLDFGFMLGLPSFGMHYTYYEDWQEYSVFTSFNVHPEWSPYVTGLIILGSLLESR